jgi:hypothetical protein
MPEVSGAVLVEAGCKAGCKFGCMALACPSVGSGFKTVAESFGFDFNELGAAAGAAAARRAELFLARRTQALSSAHARFVSGE